MSLNVDIPLWLVLPYLFMLGAVLGSFLNVVILRTPKYLTLSEQWWSLCDRPSQCPRCRTNIRWYDNIPILGWLLLRGRCRACRMWISPRYPAIELLNACLFVLVYCLEIPLGFGRALSTSCLASPVAPWFFPGYDPLSPEFALHLQYVYHMLLIESLLVASMIDFDLRIIPEISTTPATIAGVLLSTLIGRVHLAPVWYQSRHLVQSYGILLPESWHPWLQVPAKASGTDQLWVPAWIHTHPHWHGLAVSLAGAAMGYLLIKLVRVIGNRILQREAMGEGDIYLMIAIGSFLGWQATLVTFFLAPMFGLVFSVAQRMMYRDDFIPYGPFLSLAALATVLGWSTIFARTQRIFELGPLLLPLLGFMVVLFVASLLIVQGGKWLLGIPLHPPAEPLSSWGPGDQTHFFAGEFVNPWSGRWKLPEWDGNAAARGQIHENRWRYGSGHPTGPPRPPW